MHITTLVIPNSGIAGPKNIKEKYKLTTTVKDPEIKDIPRPITFFVRLGHATKINIETNEMNNQKPSTISGIPFIIGIMAAIMKAGPKYASMTRCMILGILLTTFLIKHHQ
ncbi:MAG: hypothetical protein ACTSXP_13320 [Promethearchaeota archaeon]